ncbi:MAG: AI-2E family transporter [Cyclobacteriaceae bacterium]
MNERSLKYLILSAIGIACIVFAGWYFSNIIIYIVISLVLATILRPLTNYINNIHIYRFRVPRVIAVAMSFTVLALVLWLFAFLFIPFISEQIQIFSRLNFEQLFLAISEPIERIEQMFIRNKWTREAPGFLQNGIADGIYGIFQNIDLTSLVNELIVFTGSFSIGILAVVFITFFLLYEKGIFRRQIINVIPNQYFEVSISALYKIERLLSNYLIGLLFQMTSIFTLAFVGLSIIDVKYSATIALFAAIINIIPYMGPVLGTVFAIFVGVSTAPQLFTNPDYLLLTIKIALVFGLVKLVDDLFLQPFIFSKSVKAHPLEIFIIIFAGATLAGIPGMIAAIPVYTIIRVSIMEIKLGYKSYKIFKL